LIQTLYECEATQRFLQDETTEFKN